MTSLPPGPPLPLAPGGPRSLGPSSWPTEPGKPDEPASLRSQIAIYVVGAVAIGVVCALASVPQWGVAGMLALAAGAAIGVAADLRRPFGSIPGFIVAILTMLVMTVGVVFTGWASAFALVPIVGVFVLGLDWQLVRRLRPLPFAFGFLVVIGVSGGESWTYVAGLAWMAIALGALTSLEADRRAAQPQVAPVTAGPSTPEVRTGDLATTILVALAIALVAALLLSTPSCRRDAGGGSGGGGGGSGQLTPGTPGSGWPGSETGSGPGSGSGADDRLYVPDPEGRFLIPNDGSGSADPGADGIPSPELLPGPGEPARRYPLDDGTVIDAERDPDGTGRITVEDPDGSRRTFTYRERSDGFIEIQEFDEEGRPGRTLLYDPQGRLATGDGATTDGTTPPSSGQGEQPEQPEQEEEDEADEAADSHLDWRLLVGLVVVLAAVAGLVWWWSRRRPALPAPDAPPWAIRLAEDIEREGAKRGRPRARSRSLVRYCADLREGPLPDDRLPAVADIVSSALFARSEPGLASQQWAEAAWQEIVEAHPAPGRAERRRAGASSPSA